MRKLFICSALSTHIGIEYHFFIRRANVKYMQSAGGKSAGTGRLEKRWQGDSPVCAVCMVIWEKGLPFLEV
ncbi:MAG TPA: hypothetical protein DIV56_08430 [Lachnospiraceae bacterium]|nr:hypothetical protein [Lachnospiraceae bacterium]